MHHVPYHLNIFALVSKDPSIPLLPNTPHGHAQESIPDGSDNGIFEGSWAPFSYGLGGLAPILVTPSELHCSLVPNCSYKRAVVQQVTHRLLRLITQTTLGRSKNPPLSQVFTSEDPSSDY